MHAATLCTVVLAARSGGVNVSATADFHTLYELGIADKLNTIYAKFTHLT